MKISQVFGLGAALVLFSIYMYVRKPEHTISKDRNVVSVDIFLERMAKHVCGNALMVLTFPTEEASTLKDLSLLVDKQLKSGATLSGDTYVVYRYKNERYRTIYRQEFNKPEEPTPEHIRNTYTRALEDSGYTKQELDEISTKVIEMRKNCHAKRGK